MIEKVYEVKCDYCGDVIIHGYQSVKFAEGMAKDVGMVKYKGHHFCGQECLNKFKQSPDTSYIGELK